MKYNLEGSMTDRVKFDEAQHQYAQDLLSTLPTDLAMDQDPDQYAEVGWESFLIDVENGIVAIDDIEEAKARFFNAFSKGVRDWKDNEVVK